MRSRQKIIDATVRVIERAGMPGVTVAAVAAEAGVTRQTVYANFGSVEDLRVQVYEIEMVRTLGALLDKLSGYESLADLLVDGLVGVRAAARENVLVAELFRSHEDNPFFTPGMVDRAVPVTVGVMSPVAERDPAWQGDDAALSELAELAMRMLAGVLYADSVRLRDDEALRAYLHRWIPAIVTAPTSRT